MTDEKETSLADSFNAMTTRQQNPSVLGTHNSVTWIYYDFSQRMVLTPRDGGYESVPFSQIDRDVLTAARDKLVELGGKPPALQPETSTLNKPQRGLNP